MSGPTNILKYFLGSNKKRRVRLHNIEVFVGSIYKLRILDSYHNINRILEVSGSTIIFKDLWFKLQVPDSIYVEMEKYLQSVRLYNHIKVVEVSNPRILDPYHNITYHSLSQIRIH